MNLEAFIKLYILESKSVAKENNATMQFKKQCILFRTAIRFISELK